VQQKQSITKWFADREELFALGFLLTISGDDNNYFIGPDSLPPMTGGFSSDNDQMEDNDAIPECSGIAGE
jgi:hypothetical protein